MEQLSDYLEYNHQTGILTWKKKPSKNIQIGKEAGYKSNIGYIQIGFRGKIYYAHRIAWELYYNENPPKMVDHINGNKSDNRIENLRSANNAQNMQNMGKTKRNSTGFKGVCHLKKQNKYMAVIGHKMKSIYLGVYETAEEAHAAYCKAAEKLHGAFCKTE